MGGRDPAGGSGRRRPQRPRVRAAPRAGPSLVRPRRTSGAPGEGTTDPRPANDAVASLRALGLKDRDIKRLANATSDALLGPDKPDGTTVRDEVLKQIEKKIDPAQLSQAANDFLASHGDPTPLMDLGFVPRDVAIAAGLPCANERQ